MHKQHCLTIDMHKTIQQEKQNDVLTHWEEELTLIYSISKFTVFICVVERGSLLVDNIQ